MILKRFNENRRRRCIYHLLYIIPWIKKIRPKYKNSSIVKRSKSQADEIILDACMKFENNPFKTVGEDAIFSYYKSDNYFKLTKIPKKSKIV